MEKIRSLFRESFDLDGECGVDDLVYRGIPAWDSVGHMRLVAALETEFDIMLETDEVLGLDSFTKAVEILRTHGVEGI